MQRLANLARLAHQNEEGHAGPTLAAFAGAAGAVLLGIGAANDSGMLAIVGGILAGAGFFASSALSHVQVDWDLYRQIEQLRKK